MELRWEQLEVEPTFRFLGPERKCYPRSRAPSRRSLGPTVSGVDSTCLKWAVTLGLFGRYEPCVSVEIPSCSDSKAPLHASSRFPLPTETSNLPVRDDGPQPAEKPDQGGLPLYQGVPHSMVGTS